jgi:hypothetical protein
MRPGETKRTIQAYLAEVKGCYRHKWEQSPDVEALALIIRQAVAEYHELRVYIVLPIKPNPIPKTSRGKIQRHVCNTSFLAGSLDVIEE